jgi:hypothetical protein
MKNLKDIATTICGLLIVVTGGIVVAAHANYIIVTPDVVNTCAIVGVIAASVISYFTGKNPDGSRKSPEQIDKQLGDGK